MGLVALGSLLGSVWTPEAQVWGTSCLESFPSQGTTVNCWLSECPLENIHDHTRLLRSTVIDSQQFVFLWLLLLTPLDLPLTLGLILLSMTRS